MRKIITTTFVTLDGVMQAPGGPEEDTSNGFKHGGWQAAVPMDEMMGATLSKGMNAPFELLLGKTTYNIFASYWPHAKVDNEVAVPFNRTRKYVVSHSSFKPAWNNSVCITGDLPDRQAGVVEQIKKLKQEDGPNLWVWGSGDLIQTLLKAHLIDQMQVWIYPLTIGSGKKLFANGTQAEKFKLIESKISSTGVILATYEPAGGFKTGRVDE
ncbi:MAG: dihydrofolate reductase family protein [Patescibacteria group bacterium]